VVGLAHVPVRAASESSLFADLANKTNDLIAQSTTKQELILEVLAPLFAGAVHGIVRPVVKQRVAKDLCFEYMAIKTLWYACSETAGLRNSPVSKSSLPKRVVVSTIAGALASGIDIGLYMCGRFATSFIRRRITG